MPDEPALEPATVEEVAASLADALRGCADDTAAQIAADQLVEQLIRSNFLIMRKADGKMGPA